MGQVASKLPQSAVVVIPYTSDPGLLATKVAGVGLLERSVLALKRLGVKRIRVLSLDEQPVAPDSTSLGKDPRLCGVDVAMTTADGIDVRDDYLVVPATLIWNARIFVPNAAPRERDVIITDAEDGSGRAAILTSRRAEHYARVLSDLRAQGQVSEETLAALEVERHPAGKVEMAEVSCPAGVAAAERVIFKTLVKQTDGVVSRHFNRYLSYFVSRRLAATSIHPNAVTVVTLLVGLLGAYLTAQTGYLESLLGVLLFNLNSIADGIDGELARMKFLESPFGEWFDRISDKMVLFLFFVAVLVSHFQVHADKLFVAMGLSGVLGYGIGLSLLNVYGHRLRRASAAQAAGGSGFRGPLDGLVLAVVFGGFGGARQTPGGSAGVLGQGKALLKRAALGLKNDFLSVVYLFLAAGGVLHIIFYVATPLGLALLLLSLYGLTMMIRAGRA